MVSTKLLLLNEATAAAALLVFKNAKASLFPRSYRSVGYQRFGASRLLTHCLSCTLLFRRRFPGTRRQRVPRHHVIVVIVAAVRRRIDLSIPAVHSRHAVSSAVYDPHRRPAVRRRDRDDGARRRGAVSPRARRLRHAPAGHRARRAVRRPRQVLVDGARRRPR